MSLCFDPVFHHTAGYYVKLTPHLELLSDFSLDGMFLNAGTQKPLPSGAKGSFKVALHDHVHCFAFDVAHAYQNGLGIKITQDHDVYSLALLDGVFGAFFPPEPLSTP